jgi:hypothetical protein
MKKSGHLTPARRNRQTGKNKNSTKQPGTKAGTTIAFSGNQHRDIPLKRDL